MMHIQSEGQPAFGKETENENSEDSSTQSNETDQTQSSGGDQKPDAKKDGSADTSKLQTPPPERWIERENDWKKRFNDQEVRHTSEITKLREEFAGLTKGLPTDKSSSEIPQWFGGEEDAWKQYEVHTQKLIDQATEMAVKKALGTIEERTTAEQKAIDDATQWWKAEADAIENDKELNPKGDKIDRNKLLKFTMDNEFIDMKTMKWDYRKAFKFMKPQDIFQVKKDLNERKNLAIAVTSDTRAESKPQAFKTTQDFKNPANRPW